MLHGGNIMKLDTTVAAAMLIGLTSGELRWPRHSAQGNRLHTDRARRGSPEERERLAAAEAKRARKAARGARS